MWKGRGDVAGPLLASEILIAFFLEAVFVEIILVGTCVVLPTIIGYSALSYWIFRGKAKALSYE